MQYNKTKRGIEKTAGILGVVAYSFSIIVYIALISLGCSFSNSDNIIIAEQGYSFIMLGIFYLPISIAALILSTFLIKSPIDEHGILKNRNGLRIALLVLSILATSWVMTGLLIAVLCLKDFVEQTQIQNAQNVQAKTPNTVEEKLAQIKNLKDLGVIDEATYKKAVQKVVNDFLKN